MSLLLKANLENFKFLSQAQNVLTSDEIELFLNEDQETSRIAMDGLSTFVGSIGSQRVGIAMTDFRVAGGSFASKNSQRMIAFIRHLESENTPLILILNSLGVRFMEGRSVFDDVFGVMPELYRFKQNNLFLCVAVGKALGISSLFFAQAHYRIAVREAVQLNLTGPEVHRRFFRKVDADFAQFSAADHQFDVNYLVHEMHTDANAAFRKCRDLIQMISSEEKIDAPSAFSMEDSEQGGSCLADSHNEELQKLVAQLGDEQLELFEQRSSVVRVYIARFGTQRLGVMLNPPGHPNNMLTVNAVEKYQSAMELFRALQLPVVSILDCPGGDPRKKESDLDALMKMVRLSHEMMDYPYPKMGILNGRCFGGSGIFAFPKIFGSKMILAVEGTQVGVMHKSIIDELLSGTPRLFASWKELEKKETSDLKDLLEKGTIERVIQAKDIHFELARFLLVHNRKNTEDKDLNIPTYTNKIS